MKTWSGRKNSENIGDTIFFQEKLVWGFKVQGSKFKEHFLFFFIVWRVLRNRVYGINKNHEKKPKTEGFFIWVFMGHYFFFNEKVKLHFFYPFFSIKTFAIAVFRLVMTDEKRSYKSPLSCFVFSWHFTSIICILHSSFHLPSWWRLRCLRRECSTVYSMYLYQVNQMT